MKQICIYLYLYFYLYPIYMVARMVKNPLVMQETRVQSLGQEDSLEKGMTTHSSVLAWRIPWTEDPGEPHSTVWQSQTWLRD